MDDTKRGGTNPYENQKLTPSQLWEQLQSTPNQPIPGLLWCGQGGTILRREHVTLQAELLTLPCKRWSCPICSKRMAWHLEQRINLARPQRMITLTVNPKLWTSPREAYLRTARQLSQLARTIRQERGEFEYLRSNEATLQGWPHYHLLQRGTYIDQAWLSRQWIAKTGAHIVDVRRIKDTKRAIDYVLKYVTKQASIPFTKRRLSWSRNWWPAKQLRLDGTIEYDNTIYSSKSADKILWERWPDCMIEIVTPSLWRIHEPDIVPKQIALRRNV